MNRVLLLSIWILTLFLIVVIVIIAISYIFYFDKDLSDVATSIAGFTAPILSFFGSLLLYFALIKQSEANEKVQIQINLSEEVVYFEYFLKCNIDWRNRVNDSSVGGLEIFGLYNNLNYWVDRLSVSDPRSTLEKQSFEILQGYCLDHILLLARVINSLQAGIENIKSKARRESLFTELAFFNSYILNEKEVSDLKFRLETFNERGIEMNELNELLEQMDWLRGVENSY